MRLQFLVDEASETEGFNHAGIETFRDSIYESLARECGQNSIDALLTEPVELEFRRMRVSRNEIPCIDELSSAIADCKRQLHPSPSQKREKEAIATAEQIVAAPLIDVLVVADYNTTGLESESPTSGTFHSLVKAQGVSSKRDSSAGGSFGIGKFAAFAASGVRTVLYSTLSHEGRSYLLQGKTILMSHRNSKQSQSVRSTGYIGLDRFEPQRSPQGLSSWFKRDRAGTSLFVLGFLVKENWMEKMQFAVVQNFFCAIHHGRLAVNIIDETEDPSRKVTVDLRTIERCFSDEKLKTVARSLGEEEAFEFASGLYLALTDSSALVEMIDDIPALGRMSLRLLVREGLPKRVMIARNGMAITDSLAFFNDRLARFSGYKDFVCLVQPEEARGRELLRDMENPAHDALSSERIADETRRNIAHKAMQSLAKRIRELIRKHAGTPAKEKTTLDEFAEFFPDANADSRDSSTGEELDPERPTVTQRPSRSRPREIASTGEGEAGGSAREGGANGSRPKADGSGEFKGRGSGANGPKGSEAGVQIRDLRNYMLTATRRRLFLSVDEQAEVTLRLQSSGVASETDVPLARATKGTVTSHGWVVTLEPGIRHEIEVELSEPYEGPILITASRVQP